MTEIRFYHLQTQTQAQALPALLSKALERGMHVVVKMASAAEAEQMNDHLWTYVADSFLPHGSKKDGRAEMQPIWLTDGDENPNNSKVLFLCQGANAPPVSGYDLVCEVFDGHSPEALSMVRERWKMYKAQGFETTYWQQTERGGWEQKS